MYFENFDRLLKINEIVDFLESIIKKTVSV